MKLNFEEDASRIFQQFLDGHEELYRFLAVDHAMIVGQCEVHHWQDLHFTIHCHWTLLDLVHAQNCSLWRIQDRGGKQRTEHAAVGNREGAAGHLFDAQLAVFGLGAEIADGFLDAGKAQGISVAQHRNHQASRRRYGNTDVLVAVIDDVVAVDGRVDRREAFQCFDRSAHEEGHEAQANAVVLLLECFLVAGAQGHDFLHVDLVEGGQHRRALGSLEQALGNLGAQARHRYALFRTCTLWRRSARGRRGRSSFGFGSGFGAADEVDYVFLGDATVLARARHGVRIELVFFDELAGGGAHHHLQVALVYRLRRCWRGSLRRRRSCSSGTGFDHGEQFIADDGFTGSLDYFLQHTIGWRHYFQQHLVSFNIDDEFVTRHSLTFFFVPGGNPAIGYGFG